MNISVEITMSPLQDDYEQHIIPFIKTLRLSQFTVLENPLSTQIYGEYQALMTYLTQVIGDSMQQQQSVLFYLKIVKTDRSNFKAFY